MGWVVLFIVLDFPIRIVVTVKILMCSFQFLSDLILLEFKPRSSTAVRIYGRPAGIKLLGLWWCRSIGESRIPGNDIVS